MLYKITLLAIIGVSAGVVVSGGVFTVLIAVGLIPRFAGKTHTSHCVLLYESMVILGAILGNVLTIFPYQFGLPQWFGNSILGLYGLFAGIFVGCLAIAIAEMLNAIPIFARRIGFRKGMSIALLFMALGKIVGSILYFLLVT